MDSSPTSQKVLIREFKPRDIVVSEGAATERFYLLLQGSAEVLKDSKSIRVLHEGDVFGMEYYYLRAPCPVTVKTLTAARVASYHLDTINDIVCANPKLTHRLLTSVVRQLTATTLTAAGALPGTPPVNLDGLAIERVRPAVATDTGSPPGIPQHLRNEPAGALAPDLGLDSCSTAAHRDAPDPDVAVRTEFSAPGLHDEVLSFFLEESGTLLRELDLAGEKLKLVGIPNEQESQKLIDFAQKLNRLIGGTAAMGFHQFSQLSRKTSLIAARCAEIREMTIRILISNLNLVVSVLADCFQNLDSIKKAEQMIPQLDQRLDICMVALGIEHPDIQSQSDIDAILERYRIGNPA
jgi:hypothetical protein